MHLITITPSTLVIIAITWLIAGFIVWAVRKRVKKVIVKNPYGKTNSGIENTSDNRIAYSPSVVVNIIYKEELINVEEIADFTIDFQDWKSGKYLTSQNENKSQLILEPVIKEKKKNNIDTSKLATNAVLKKK